MRGEDDMLHLENMSPVSIQQPPHCALTMNILTTPPLDRFIDLLTFDLLHECKVPVAELGLLNVLHE